jgi:hypothetical protein
MFLVTVNENDSDSSDHVPLSELKKIFLSWYVIKFKFGYQR